MLHSAASDPNTIRAILVLLANRGRVGREQHPTDGRARCVILTRKGQQVFRKLSGELKPLRQRLLGAFPSKNAKTLVAFLGRISEAMAPPNNRQARSKEPLKGEEP